MSDFLATLLASDIGFDVVTSFTRGLVNVFELSRNPHL